MKLSINMIKECLDGVRMDLSAQIGDDTSFEKIMWLSKYVSRPQENTLYLADADTLEAYISCRKPECLQGVCFLCVGAALEGMPPFLNDVPCIMISEQYDLALIGNRLLDYWGGIKDWCRQLDVMVYAHKEMQDFLNISREYFDGAFVIWDKSFNILAHIATDKVSSTVLSEAVEQGYFTKDIIENIIKRNLLNVKVSNYTTRHIPAQSTVTNYELLVRHYCRDGFRLYSIAYFMQDRHMAAAQRERLECLYDHMIRYLEETDQTPSEQNLSVNVFFEDILSGRISNDWEIYEKAQAFHIRMDNRYLCYVLSFDEYSKTKASYVINYLKRVLPLEHMFEHEGNVVLIKDIRNYNCVELGRVSSFENLLRTCMACCGISSTLDALEQIPAAYKQSLAAIRLGKLMRLEDGPIFFYKNYYYYHMLEIVNQEMDLTMIYYKELKGLMEEDAKHNTNHFQFLEILLKNNMSVTDTAAELFLHRNSVIYRMKKLEQIMKIDFDNSEEVHRLYFSLMSQRYLSALERRKKEESERLTSSS